MAVGAVVLVVAVAWAPLSAERQAEFLRYLYRRMHSPQSVTMFEGA